MKDLIVAHLIETYSPDTIILHGSRARGKERAHSDWDFILLYTNPPNVKMVEFFMKIRILNFLSILSQYEIFLMSLTANSKTLRFCMKKMILALPYSNKLLTIMRKGSTGR